jgi:taurine dioxygenase
MDRAIPQAFRHIEVHPLSTALGAEIEGVDLSRPLTDDVVAEIRRAFLAYLVIFFRRQELAPQNLLDVAARFGEPMAYPQLEGLPGFPLVTLVKKLEQEEINFGGAWHSDTSYLECPPKASMLYAVEIPQIGGDTLFANQYMAYETLSAGLKETLAPLVGVNTSTNPVSAVTRVDRMKEVAAELKVLVGEHPVARTHPETGRVALYINHGHTSHFKGWTEQESMPLLRSLFDHQIKSEFTCRLRWQPGTLAVWDNRCTQHYPMNDYHGHRRVMHRVTLAGERPL